MTYVIMGIGVLVILAIGCAAWIIASEDDVDERTYAEQAKRPDKQG